MFFFEIVWPIISRVRTMKVYAVVYNKNNTKFTRMIYLDVYKIGFKIKNVTALKF